MLWFGLASSSAGPQERLVVPHPSPARPPTEAPRIRPGSVATVRSALTRPGADEPPGQGRPEVGAPDGPTGSVHNYAPHGRSTAARSAARARWRTDPPRAKDAAPVEPEDHVNPTPGVTGAGERTAADETTRPEPEPEAEATSEHPRARGSAGSGPAVPAWLDTLAQFSWRLLVVLVGVSGLVLLLTRLYLVSLPIILALVFATIAVPPARRLERRGVPGLLAALIVVVGGTLTLLGGLILLIPAFTRQVAALGPTVNEAFDQVLDWVETGPLGLDRGELETIVTDAIGNIGEFSGTIATQVGTIALAVGEVLTALSLAVVLLFFFVKDGEQIVGWFISRAPERLRDDMRASGARGWGALAGYVRGTAAIALIDAVGIGLGLLIVGIPLVLPLTLLVFIGGFVPVIGAFISGLLATLVALATGGLTTALIVLAIVVVVQQVESSILQPMIMRRAVSLHPIVILTVLTAGAVIVGVLGAFLAVPIAATLAAVGNELRLRGELRRRGVQPGSGPLGGRGVDPELGLPEAAPAAPRRRRPRATRRADA